MTSRVFFFFLSRGTARDFGLMRISKSIDCSLLKLTGSFSKLEHALVAFAATITPSDTLLKLFFFSFIHHTSASFSFCEYGAKPRRRRYSWKFVLHREMTKFFFK